MNLEDSLSDSSAVFDQCLQESSDEEPPPSSLPSNLLIGEYRPKESIISKFFPSRPEIKPPRSYDKTNSKVLTSAKNRKIILEKERLKKEKLEEKERRKQEKERK